MRYERNVRLVEPFIGRVRLTDLKPAALQSTYARLLRRGLAPRTVRQAHAVLHRALRQAVLWELIPRNPVDAVSPPRARAVEMKTLGRNDVQRLFEHTKDHRLHAMWIVLATTGMRLGEALGLKWEDVDLELGRVQIRRGLQRQPGAGLVFIELKTARSKRMVYLAPGAVAALRKHRGRQAMERLAAGDRWNATYGLVFATRVGRPIESGLINWSLARALRGAGLPRVRVHDLRHTAASLLLEAGVHPKVVQETLGHSTISLTLDTYSHVTPGLQMAAATEMQRLFESRESQEDVRTTHEQDR